MLLDELDLSAIANSIDINAEIPPGNVTAFGDTDATFVEGKPGFTIEVSGLWSLASPNYDAEIFGNLTSISRQLGIYPEGAAEGARGYEGTTLVSRDGIGGEVAGIIKLDVTWRGQTPLVRTQVLYKKTAGAASEDGTAYQHGAVLATQKVVAVLRLLAVPDGTGDNTCNVVIKSDDQQGFAGTPEPQITFSQLDQTSIALFEKKTQEATITDDWWRVEVTIAGIGSRTFNLVIIMGIVDRDG